MKKIIISIAIVCSFLSSTAKADQSVATLPGFLEVLHNVFKDVEKDICSCKTKKCQDNVMDGLENRGFRAGFNYTQGKKATKQLTDWATERDSKKDMLPWMVNNLEWVPPWIQRVNKCEIK